MRRDEIKIFPGNIETHLHRIDRFGNSTALLASESEQLNTEERPPLEYLSPAVARSQRLFSLRRTFWNASSGCVLLLLACISIYRWWHALPPVTWAVIFTVALLLSPGIWTAFHALNRRLRD